MKKTIEKLRLKKINSQRSVKGGNNGHHDIDPKSLDKTYWYAG